MRVPLAVALSVAVAACDQGGSAKRVAGPAVASGPPAVSAPAPASASARPRAPAQPWYSGAWKGTYEARHYLIEMTRKQGTLREWAKDDGGRASGQGELSVVIADDGTATGSAKGPLGPMRAVGEVDEGTLRLRVRADPAGGGGKRFNGFALLERSDGGSRLTGLLQASSGDGRTVRDAPVVLEKASGAAE